MVPLRFETSSLPTDQQFAAWQAHMSVLLTTHLPESAQPDDGSASRSTYGTWTAS
ncbi:transcriptional regulator [Brucella melitensis]